MNRNESRYFATARRMDSAFLELLEKKNFAYITVKEICQKAGVNRSTFYLHYETIEDLLSETLEMMNEQFQAYMDQAPKLNERIQEGSLEELCFITPEYLQPYLRYVMENKRLFRTAMKNADTLRLEENYRKMFRWVFTPILERYEVSMQDRPYLMAFYIHGLMALITEWLQTDCAEPIEHVMGLIERCVLKNKL